jgi:hypothetical protein
VTPKSLQPKVIDVFGPELTTQLAECVTDSIRAKLDLVLTKDEVVILHRAARAAAKRRALGQPGVGLPVTGVNRRAVDNLRTATLKMLAALKSISEIADQPIIIGRENLAAMLIEDDWDMEDNVDFIVNTTEQIFARIIPDLDVIRRRAESLLSTAKLVERGRGRRLEAYDDFIIACYRVWRGHRTGKGWSKKNGGGAGDSRVRRVAGRQRQEA